MATSLSIAFTPTPVPIGQSMVIEMTAQVSAGRSFASRSQYKKVAVLAAATASPANVLAAYNALFGALIAGKRIFYRAYSIGSASGFKSEIVQGSIVVS